MKILIFNFCVPKNNCRHVQIFIFFSFTNYRFETTYNNKCIQNKIINLYAKFVKINKNFEKSFLKIHYSMLSFIK
jgi:hypothetical protein